MTQEKPPKILAAMHSVMSKLTHLSKNRSAPDKVGGYAYRGIDDLMAALHPLLVKYKIIILPQCLSRDWQFQTQKFPPWEMAVTMRYVFKSTEDGSEVFVEAPGMGGDQADKCSGKAATNALKVAIYQTFCVPIIEASIDPEASDDTPPPAKAPANTTKPAPQPAAAPAQLTPSQVKVQTEKMVAKVMADSVNLALNYDRKTATALIRAACLSAKLPHPLATQKHFNLATDIAVGSLAEIATQPKG